MGVEGLADGGVVRDAARSGQPVAGLQPAIHERQGGGVARRRLALAKSSRQRSGAAEGSGQIKAAPA